MIGSVRDRRPPWRGWGPRFTAGNTTLKVEPTSFTLRTSILPRTPKPSCC